MTVLIVNPMNDAHAQYIGAILRQKGIACTELGSFHHNDYAWQDGALYYNGSLMERVSAVLFRSVLNPAAADLSAESEEERYNAQVRFGVQAEMLRNWLAILSEAGVPVINPPLNRSKMHQLAVLSEAGIPLPRTCITSSPEVARSFASKVGPTVYKPLKGGSFCRKTDEDFWREAGRTFIEPVIFQEEIEGEDVRVNMLDGRILSAHAIKKSSPGVLDYREDPAYGAEGLQYGEVVLPEETVRFCSRAMHLLGLRFSGIDLRKTKAGYVLLECNSMPAFLDIELKTGARIAGAIADWLAEPEEKRLFAGHPVQLDYDEGKERPSSSSSSGPIFDYYGPMKQFREMAAKQANRQILAMNELQKQQVHEATGRMGSFMEIKLEEGQAEIIRIW